MLNIRTTVRNFRRSGTGLFLVLSVSLGTNPADLQAQTTHNWTAAAGGNWNSGATVWDVTPTFLANTDETLNFGSFLTATTAGYTATNNVAGGAFTRVINFNNTYGSPAITVANTSTLTFNSAGGLNPSLNQNGFGAASINAFTVAPNTPFTYGGSGVGNLSLTGIITANNNNPQTINQTGGGFLGTGAKLIITGANLFGTNPTITVNAGNVVANNAAALGGATSTVIVNGGTFQHGTVATGTINANFSLNSNLVFTHHAATFLANTYGGVISDGVNGARGINFDNTTNFQESFTNNSTFTGPVNVNSAFGIAVNMFLASPVGQATNGRFSGTTSITLSPISTLRIDNTNAATAVARLNPAATLTLNRANFAMTAGASTAAANESIATLVSNGHSVLTLNYDTAATPAPVAAASSNFTTGTWTRNNLATAFIAAPNLGNAPGAGVGSWTITNNPGGAIGGILPYAAANTSATTTATNTLVRYDTASGRIAGLNLTTDYQAGALPVFLNSSATAQYRQTSTQAGLSGDRTVNALLLDTSGAATQFVQNGLAGTGTLNVTSGAILSSLFGGASAGTVANSINVGTLAFGSNPGYFHTPAGLIVTSTITGSAGISRAGGGALTLTGDNTFTGGVFTQFGNIVIEKDSNLGAASNTITMASGTSGIFVLPNALYTTGGSNTLNTARNIVVAGGGGVVVVSNTTASMTSTGTISGDGQFAKNGGGTLFLDPASGSNTYQGRTSVAAGVLAVRNDAAMGSGGAAIEFLAGGVGILQPMQGFTTPRNVLMSGTATFFTNGSNLQIDGTLGTQSLLTTVANLIKLGTGDLVLTAANTYNAATTVGTALGATGGGVVASAGVNGTQTGGRLVLQGANGSAALSTGFTLNPGTALVLDNSAGVNNFRVGMVPQGHTGSELSLTGNATNGANTTQAIGAYTSNTLGSTVTVNQPASAGTNNVTTLQAISYASATNSTTFFRGNNLGGATGDRTAVVFNTAPALTAGIIPSAVGATTANGAPTDFVTLSGNSVVMFNAYTPNNVNAGAGAVTDITAANVLGAASTAGAARLSTGGTVDLAGNVWTISTGSLLTTGAGGNTITNSGLSNPVALGANGRITNTTDLTFGTNAIVTGTTVTKFGAGTLTLNQNGSTPTTWNVGQGTLRYGTGAATALPVGATVNTAPGATLDLNNNTGVTLASIAGFGNVNVGTGGLTVTGTSIFMGSLQGSGPLTTTATTFTASGNSSSYTGNWNVNAGTLSVASNNALGTGTINLGANTGTATATMLWPAGAALTTISNPIVVGTGTGTKTIGPASTVAGISIEFSGGITHSGTANLTLTGAFNSTAVQAGAYTVTGNITGTGPIQWFGGNWNLHGNNGGFSGTVSIDNFPAMVMGVGTDNALGTGTVTWSANGGNLRADNGARTLGNAIVVNGSANAFGFTGMNDITLAGPITLNSTGTTNHNVNVINKGTTTFAGTISAVSATAPMSKTGFGDLILSGTNTFAGGFALNSGALGFGSSSAGGTGSNGPVGTGTLTVNAANSNGAVLRAVGGARTVNNNVTVNGDFVVDGSNALQLGGTMDLGTANRTIAVTNTANTTFAGVVNGNGGGITKQGAGTLVLRDAANTYTGGTTVNAGTLLVSNTPAGQSGTGTGPVTVNAGGTLGGTDGIIGGAVTVNPGGTLKPGSSPGNLTVGGATLGAGATFGFEYITPVVPAAPDSGGSATPGTGNSNLNVTGAFSVDDTATGSVFKITGNFSDFTPFQTYSFQVSNVTGLINGGAGFNITNPAQFDTTQFAGFNPASLLQWHNVGGTVFFNFTPVPEPSHVLLACGVAAGAAGWWRRRKLKRK